MRVDFNKAVEIQEPDRISLAEVPELADADYLERVGKRFRREVRDFFRTVKSEGILDFTGRPDKIILGCDVEGELVGFPKYIQARKTVVVPYHYYHQTEKSKGALRYFAYARHVDELSRMVFDLTAGIDGLNAETRESEIGAREKVAVCEMFIGACSTKHVLKNQGLSDNDAIEWSRGNYTAELGRSGALRNTAQVGGPEEFGYLIGHPLGANYAIGGLCLGLMMGRIRQSRPRSVLKWASRVAKHSIEPENHVLTSRYIDVLLDCRTQSKPYSSGTTVKSNA